MVGEKSVLPGCVAACHVDRRFFSPSFFFSLFFFFRFFDRTKRRRIMGFVERFVTKFVRLIRPFDSIVFLFFIYIFGFLVN